MSMAPTGLAEGELSSLEISRLREHGIVLFRGRVIFDAQPPMPENQISEVQERCSGRIPGQLLELWRLTAGGSLDYALNLEMAGNREALSWCELFFNDSSGYRDLRGWIEHELELAEEAADELGIAWSGKLDALPFGGFEYCDRVYVDLRPGKAGRVLAWKQGLPPAWTHRLHEDSVAEVGIDLYSAFDALHLPEDPLAPTEKFFAGATLLDQLAERVKERGLQQGTADRLIAFYRRALIDWRALLSDGTLAQHRELALSALERALRTDDAALVKQLIAAGVPVHLPLAGSALPIEFALSGAAYHAAQALIDSGAPVTPRCLNDVCEAAPVELLQSLLAHGAEPAVDTVIACAEYGATEGARLVARACAAKISNFRVMFADARRERVKELRKNLKEVRAGKLSHFLSPEQLQQHIDALMAFTREDS